MNATAQSRTLQDIAQPPTRGNSLAPISPGFGSLQSFELMQRAAKMLTHSTLVPVAYRARVDIKEYGKVVGQEDNPSGLSNCVVALNMAQRMGADPLMVMQNLYIVEGRPSWSSQFIIAAINSCGKYSPLRFDLSEPSKPTEVSYTATEWQDQPNGGRAKKVTVSKKVTVRHQTCVAWAIEKETGERLESPSISIQMAIDEGWLTKSGSKWLTMPEIMLRYRAAAFFGKIYAPELLMGLQTAEEAHDIIDVDTQPDGSLAVDVNKLRESQQDGGGERPRRRTAPADTMDVEAPDDIGRPDATPAAAETTTHSACGVVHAHESQDAPQADETDENGYSADEVGQWIYGATDLDSLDIAGDLIKAVQPSSARAQLSASFEAKRRHLANPQPSQQRRPPARGSRPSVE